jgi:hypothetical protein
MPNQTRTLVIGDAHDSPGVNKDRFRALGNLITDIRPTNIVQIGDWGSYDSISFHNKGKPLLQEGARLADDIASAREAYALTFDPLKDEVYRQRKNRKRPYWPNVYWLEANHEYRIQRYLMENPVLIGMLPETDLVNASADGATLVPWREYCYIDGVAFTHIPFAKRSSTPIGGEFVTKRAAEFHDTTIVFGHTHRLLLHDNARIRERSSPLVHAINVGWFGDYIPEYVESEVNMDWWSGLVLLHHTNYGQVDVETISMARIKEKYL